MKKLVVSLLVMVFMVSVVDEASAQRRGKKRRTTNNTEVRSSRDSEPSTPFSDKLNIEIKPGNLNFFGNQLSLSMKSNVGYKLNNTFSAGLGGKLFYDFFNFPGSSSDISFFSYGGLGYARAKISQTFYLQGEYSLVSFGEGNLNPQRTIAYPTAGIGYMQQGFNWSYGLEILAVLNDEVRDRIGIVEYWINFSKNF